MVFYNEASRQSPHLSKASHSLPIDKPGITDYASLEYYKENELLGKSQDARKTYIEEVMPAKLDLNLKYINEYGLVKDLRIMWRTFVKILS